MINRQAIKENSKLQLGNRIFGNLWLMALLVCFLHEVLISAASGIITIGSIIIMVMVSRNKLVSTQNL